MRWNWGVPLRCEILYESSTLMFEEQRGGGRVHGVSGDAAMETKQIWTQACSRFIIYRVSFVSLVGGREYLFF